MVGDFIRMLKLINQSEEEVDNEEQSTPETPLSHNQ